MNVPIEELGAIGIVIGAPEISGGHVVQAQRTADALRALGADVVVGDCDSLDPASFDIIHSFDAPIEWLREARSSGAYIAISPIWWSAAYRTRDDGRATLLEECTRRARVSISVLRRGPHRVAKTLRSFLEDRRVAYELADVLLPNSEMEAEAIRTDLAITTPTHVVPNAVDVKTFDHRFAGHIERTGVLYVARIEPHKNQLGLIRALRGSGGFELTLIGHPHPHHPRYVQRVMTEAEKAGVRVLPGVDQGSLVEHYAKAKVHVLPSWFETTGLVSLEAALSGCVVVTTSRGYASEYFGQEAIYCDPGEPRSIRESVERAMASDPSTELAERIRAEYSWERAAESTIAAYSLGVRI